MPKPKSISIIGAGISGLTLARLLKHRGIPTTIYERDSAKRFAQRHGYGITLWAYRPLLGALGMSEGEFKRRCAVDGGSGRVGRTAETGGVVPFRANRRALEGMLLGEGVDVQWEHKLVDVKTEANDRLQLTFDNNHTLSTDLLVGADGAHSSVRQSIAPSAQFKILPLAAYNGKRRIPRVVFDENYTPHMNGLTTMEHDVGATHLTLAIDDYADDMVSVSYTFSRAAQAKDDPLARLERPNAGATEIPEAFYEEIAGLSFLPAPLDRVFDPAEMRNDRLLHWLMRSVLPNRGELEGGAEKGVVLLADAAHHAPILGSEGANVGMEDAVALADVIAEDRDEGVRRFYEKKWEEWRRYVEEGERRLEGMHGTSASHL